jgi:RND family efflux transporter MFP subunit
MGRVTWQHDSLVPGGRVKAGETLLRVDARDYELAADQQEANVERAELQLRLEQIQREVATDEWNLISEGQDVTDEGRALALREPHVQAARANLAAAKNAQALARLSVGKTAIRAPFNAWVQSELVEVGQLVGPQSQVATLIGTDSYWVQVSVPADQLDALLLPGSGDGTASNALVRQTVGGKKVERSGRLLRLLGDLDPVGRLVRVLVEIEDPLRLNGSAQAAEELPMLLGAYVSVEFEGKELSDVAQVPRSAVREGDRVFLYGPDHDLVIRPVEIVWRTHDAVLVEKGLQAGDRLITSRIATPVAGMKLRTSSKPKVEHALRSNATSASAASASAE